MTFYRSNNLAARIFHRQILSPPPSTSVNTARLFYENLFPGHTIYDVECPDHSFRKFTDDGLYLVCFSRNYQDLIVCRPTWLTYSCRGEECDGLDAPQSANRFSSFFKQLYSVTLPSHNEIICKDFFLYIERLQFGLFATSTVPANNVSVVEGALQAFPYMEKITFYLIRLEDGVVLDEKALCNDFISFSHNVGAYLYDDLLCIMSLRFQMIHILRIRDSGNFVEVRKIGTFCQEDDELFLHSHAQSIANVGPKNPDEQSINEFTNSIQHPQANPPGSSFLTGMKQRLLSYIFRKTWDEEADQTMRVQHLKKKFYFHFQDYVDLIMCKVQFLDRQHLLIKFGSFDGAVPRCTDQNLSFFAVYNMESTEIVSFYQNSSEDLYTFFEQFCDHFCSNSSPSLHGNFISSHSNNVHALEQLLALKNRGGSFLQFARKQLLSLPWTCQSQSPSPYFDLSLFRYDDKLISALDRHRHCQDNPIKFTSARQRNAVKFKIKPGPECGGSDTSQKKLSSFVFHPFLPLALSIQQTYMQPTVVNIHFRR